MDKTHIAAAVIHFQQAVDGRSCVPGQFAQPLGGAACGGAECHAVIQGLVQAQNRVDRRRLAGAGAAGQHHHAAGQCQLDGQLLQRRVLKALGHFQHADIGVQRLGHLGREGGQLPQPRGDIFLGTEQVWQVDILHPVKRAGAQFLGTEQFVQARFNFIGRHAQEF